MLELKLDRNEMHSGVEQMNKKPLICRYLL